MKLTSKKLLLWLYPVESQTKRRVPFWQVEMLLPELTTDGRLSLVRHLENQQLLFTDKLTGRLHLSLSAHGKTQLEADFPALVSASKEQGANWQLIIFMGAPASDPNFRYLRNLLLQEHCFSLKRGVYMHPGELSAKLENILHASYRGAVAIVQIDKWQFGDEQAVIGQKSEIKDVAAVYSGIGKELESLLAKIAKIKEPSNQQKKLIASIFDRFVTNLQQDNGYIPYLLPESINALEILAQLQLGVG